MGSVSLGYGPDGKRIRRKVLGKTKQEVRDRLKALHKEMDAGVKSSKTYTVQEAVEDWLREGLDGTSERTRTLYEGLLGPLLDAIGARPLRVLSAGDVRSGLSQLADHYSTRSLQITRLSLERAIRHAEADNLVGRNVAALVKSPQAQREAVQELHAGAGEGSAGRGGGDAAARLRGAEPAGRIRTEEARALRWDHVVTWVDDSAGWQPVTTAGFDPARVGEDRYAIYVLRAERRALHEEVFPVLTQFCREQGARFQPIDLRWGVSAEAGRDHRTMQICLDEIARCQCPRSAVVIT